MREASINGYLAALEGDLRFDRRLARRISLEVRDHLEQRVAALPATLGVAEREALAIARFGSAESIATEIAITAQRRSVKRLALALAGAVAGVYLAMAARAHWMSPASPHALLGKQVAGAVLAIDVASFVAALLAGTAALALGWSSLREPKRWRAARRCAAFATATLAVSVAADMALARSTDALALTSLAFECAISGALASRTACAMRQSSQLDRLLL